MRRESLIGRVAKGPDSCWVTLMTQSTVRKSGARCKEVGSLHSTKDGEAQRQSKLEGRARREEVGIARRIKVGVFVVSQSD